LELLIRDKESPITLQCYTCAGICGTLLKVSQEVMFQVVKKKKKNTQRGCTTQKLANKKQIKQANEYEIFICLHGEDLR
jgi:hypothetical protein